VRSLLPSSLITRSIIGHQQRCISHQPQLDPLKIGSVVVLTLGSIIIRIPVYLILDMIAQGFSPEEMEAREVQKQHVELAARYASAYLKMTYTLVGQAFDAADAAQP
jgi:hypothetical protein